MDASLGRAAIFLNMSININRLIQEDNSQCCQGKIAAVQIFEPPNWPQERLAL